MTFQAVDLTAEAGQASLPIDWHKPHAIFAILLVGPDEVPFGIQKDLLCAQSPYYRAELDKPQHRDQAVELVIKLPTTDVTVFGCFQNFIYTGKVYEKTDAHGVYDVPDYTLLMGVWKLATQLQMAPLRVAVLNAMAERRQLTSTIPDVPLMIRAWKETGEGSGLRKMLIEWAAEHMRSTPTVRNEFARALPQEILSELVIAMSDLPPAGDPVVGAFTAPKHQLYNGPIDIEAEHPRPVKRVRKSEAILNLHLGGPEDAFEVKPNVKKAPRKSAPAATKTNRRVSMPAPLLTPEQEMTFCAGLIDRMIRGPGFWTRLVGPFKHPVNPAVDNVPNYFDVVKRPMDLSTIKSKIVNGNYNSAQEFEADVRLIFQNCYEYWTPEAPIWKTCQEFENYFNTQWNERHEYRGPKNKIKTEVID